MRKPISKNAFNQGDAGLVFSLNEMANKRKEEGAKVINVTFGTLFDDNGKLISFSKINELVTKNNNEFSRVYAPLDGGNLFKTNVESWVFGEYIDNLKSKYFFDSCVTPGGTGALYLAFRNYIDDNPLLIPELGWANYKALCNQMNKNFIEYPMFRGNKFATEDLLEKCEESIKLYGSCSVLINDPCENPTGYSLSDSEWARIIDSLNQLNQKGPVNLILDVAYMDVAKEPRRFFKHLTNKKIGFNVLVCFSASKLFGIYGYRLGAIICLNSIEENVKDFIKASKLTSRAVWSNCNHLMINAFNDFCADKAMISELHSELNDIKALLKDRYLRARETFDALLECEPYPYEEGFFLVYPKDNAKEFNKKLIEKDIFALPLDNKYIRISICSFSKN